MLTREVLHNARHLVDWKQTAADLEDALNQASATLAEWQAEGYTEVGPIAVWIDDATMVASLFLGTVFTLMPSGKYYTAWANSNVEKCPRCQGFGNTANGKTCTWCNGFGSREAWLDEIWGREIDRMGYRFGVFVFSGEGSPTDLFVGASRDLPQEE